jgi:hypothetical protein
MLRRMASDHSCSNLAEDAVPRCCISTMRSRRISGLTSSTWSRGLETDASEWRSRPEHDEATEPDRCFGLRG